MSIKQKDIKKLFSLSAGRCNLCQKELMQDDIDIGEIAHIVARKSGGPRGDPLKENVNSYDNLILLCMEDHKKIDNAPESFTVENLLEIKQKHEGNIASRLKGDNSNYLSDLDALNILFRSIPILPLRGMALQLPNKLSIEFDASDVFNNFVIDFPEKYPFNDKDLYDLWEELLAKQRQIDQWINGNLYECKFMTMDDILNQRCPPSWENIYISDDHDFMVLNKRRLNSKQRLFVENKMSVYCQEFIYIHTTLIQYLRDNFKESLNS